MSIQDYRAYCDQYLLNNVNEYLKKEYNDAKYILCWFDLYYIDITRKSRIRWSPEKTILKRETYVSLLLLILKHPEITFYELPRYIPFQLYEDLLFYLQLPTTRHFINPDRPHSRSIPIAVEMTTLQRDVYEIAGDKPYNFCINSNTPEFEFEVISVSIWMKKMEIDLRYTSKNHKVNAVYGMIDVESVMNALKVKTYKGIDGAFWRMWNKLPNDKSDVFWIIRWIDNHGIKYIKAIDISNITK